MTKEDLKHLKNEYDSLMEMLSVLGETAFGYVTGEPLCEELSDEELETAAHDTSWKEHKEIKLFRQHQFPNMETGPAVMQGPYQMEVKPFGFHYEKNLALSVYYRRFMKCR